MLEAANGGKRNFWSIHPALATIYIFEIAASEMEIPLIWNQLCSEIPIWLVAVMPNIKHLGCAPYTLWNLAEFDTLIQLLLLT